MDNEQRTTTLGSPCSPAWDDAHIALVDAAEAAAGKRICGARTGAGNPCALDPNHANGRCRFHGGFDMSGAQPGNRNAVIHGLYSRGVQTCGEHCPMWKTCPCAGKDITALPENDRPKCPFETVQYNAALTDALARASTMPHTDGLHRQTAHHVAMLSAMVMRCAAAVSVNPLTDTTEVKGEKYAMTTQKPGPYMQAYLRLSSELRRYMALLDSRLRHAPAVVDFVECKELAQCDTSLLPEDVATYNETRDGNVRKADALVKQALRISEKCSPDDEVFPLMKQAQKLSATFVDQFYAAFNPRAESPINRMRWRILEGAPG